MFILCICQVEIFYTSLLQRHTNVSFLVTMVEMDFDIWKDIHVERCSFLQIRFSFPKSRSTMTSIIVLGTIIIDLWFQFENENEEIIEKLEIDIENN